MIRVCDTLNGHNRAVALCLALCACLAALAAPRHAAASSGQLSVIEDSARVLSGDPATQDAALDEAASLSADILKIPVLWRNYAPQPTARTRPDGDLADPAAYPAGVWNALDRAVAGARSRGMHVWLAVTAPAPRWTEARESKPVPGAYLPDPAEYGKFVAAVAKRYPDVNYWSIWNEPNLAYFLQPQWVRGVAVGAVHYRKLYRAAYASLVANGHQLDTIMFGEILPRAPFPHRANGTLPPVMWLRAFLCLDDANRRLTGAAAKAYGCAGSAPIEARGFAYHDYTTPAGPLWRDDKPLNATIRHLPRVIKVLDAAHSAGTLAMARMPVYSSEFGFQSNPPDHGFVPLRRIPFYLNVSEYMSYRNRRVATYSQYGLVDDPQLTGYQTGLRFKNGREKPGVYDAYRLPLIVVLRGSGTVLVWGKLRERGAGPLKVTIENGNGARFSSLATLSVNRHSGYFQRVLRVANAARQRFRASAGALSSRVAAPIAEPVMLP